MGTRQAELSLRIKTNRRVLTPLRSTSTPFSDLRERVDELVRRLPPAVHKRDPLQRVVGHLRLGSFASQDFEFCLRDCCGSFAESCGDLRRITWSLQNDQQALRRFAETTNPREKLAEKRQSRLAKVPYPRLNLQERLHGLLHLGDSKSTVRGCGLDIPRFEESPNN